MSTKKTSKNINYFECINCNFKCCKKGDLNRHILTPKHKMSTESTEIHINTSIHICEKCNKNYKDRSGLWRHKQKCVFIKENTNEEKEKEKEKENINEEETKIDTDVDMSDKNLILTLIQQNNELQKQMLEVIKNGTNNTTINNSNINSNNKSFNLQVFLNETCKDAMNIMDFVDSIKISLSDIESIGELGFVNGMSKLIIKNLNALDENMRPVHCNDLKRESLFVKDANVWVKEDADNNKLKKAIKYIAHKNICALPEWRKKYPDCEYSESKKSDQYNHIVIEAMGGAGDNDDEKADKIISKIAKTITIDKKN